MKKKFNITYKIIHFWHNEVEIEAESYEEAVKKAQALQYEVEEETVNDIPSYFDTEIEVEEID